MTYLFIEPLGAPSACPGPFMDRNQADIISVLRTVPSCRKYAAQALASGRDRTRGSAVESHLTRRSSGCVRLLCTDFVEQRLPRRSEAYIEFVRGATISAANLARFGGNDLRYTFVA